MFIVPSHSPNGNVAINRGIGTQLFIRVPGSVVHHITAAPLQVPWLSTGGPIPLGVTLRNTGTVHQDFYAPNNRITAQTGTDRIRFPDLTVFAGATRHVTSAWTNPPAFCHCTITVAVPQPNGTTTTLTTTVWILPLYRILGAGLILIGAYLVLRWRRQRHQTALAAARQRGFQEALQKSENASS